MTRSTLRDVGTVLEIHQVSTHVLMAPGGIARKIGDVVPLIIRTPGKVHGVDLRTPAESRAARIVQAGTVISLLA